MSVSGDSTRDKILLAAGVIFARKGFAKTTIREICDSAGVNVASINYYFGDKQKLYTEALMLAQKIQVQENPQPTFEPKTSAEEKLQRLIATLLKRMMAMKSEPWQVRLLMREVLQPTAASEGLIEAYFRPFFDALLAVLDELHGAPLPSGIRQQTGVSIIGQCQIYRTSAEMITRMLTPEEREHFTIERLTEHITRFSLAAIKGMQPPIATSIPTPVKTASIHA